MHGSSLSDSCLEHAEGLARTMHFPVSNEHAKISFYVSVGIYFYGCPFAISSGSSHAPIRPHDAQSPYRIGRLEAQIAALEATVDAAKARACGPLSHSRCCCWCWWWSPVPPLGRLVRARSRWPAAVRTNRSEPASQRRFDTQHTRTHHTQRPSPPASTRPLQDGRRLL